MKNIYTDGQYSGLHPTYHVEDSAWKCRQVVAMIKRHSLTPQSVCEVGCGAGEILKQLQQAMPESVTHHGFDVSPHAIEMSQSRANPRLQFFCSDFILADTPQYELLLCMDVIEHVDDYIGFLRKLRPRGIYKIFHIPLELSAQNVIRARPIAEARKENGHLHYFTKDTALATLSYAGYEVIDWMYTGSGVDKRFGLLNLIARYPRILLSRCSPDFTVRVLGGYSMLVLTK